LVSLRSGIVARAKELNDFVSVDIVMFLIIFLLKRRGDNKSIREGMCIVVEEILFNGK